MQYFFLGVTIISLLGFFVCLVAYLLNNPKSADAEQNRRTKERKGILWFWFVCFGIAFILSLLITIVLSFIFLEM